MAETAAGKSQPKWLWILLALVVFALPLIWWLSDTDAEPEPVGAEIVGANTPGADPVTPPEPVGLEQGITVADILGNPAQYVGQEFNVTGVSVPEVPSDRGFWIEDQGQRLFTVIIDVPRESRKDINPGQQLAITEAMVRDATFLSELPGRDIDPETRRIINEQDAFLVVDEENVEILSGGSEARATVFRRATSGAA